ncbi:MAG TPA: hypothetical protein VE913_15265 [Longimicrobium sp.]|nr:hypothetical protein [Longimicrobium sp.]
MSSQPDSEFRLSAAERARVRGGLDVDALERFLRALPPPTREQLLPLFHKVRPGTPGPLLTQMNDPDLQLLLDEVWAPRWRMLTPQQISEWDRHQALVRQPLAVAIVPDAGAPRAAAVVLRRGRTSPNTVILLRESSADGPTLHAAMEALERDEALHPEPPRKQRRITIADAPRGRVREDQERSYEARIAEARRTPKRLLDGVGDVHAIIFSRVPHDAPEMPGRAAALRRR